MLKHDHQKTKPHFPTDIIILGKIKLLTPSQEHSPKKVVIEQLNIQNSMYL